MCKFLIGGLSQKQKPFIFESIIMGMLEKMDYQFPVIYVFMSLFNIPRNKNDILPTALLTVELFACQEKHENQLERAVRCQIHEYRICIRLGRYDPSYP